MAISFFYSREGICNRDVSTALFFSKEESFHILPITTLFDHRLFTETCGRSLSHGPSQTSGDRAASFPHFFHFFASTVL